MSAVKRIEVAGIVPTWTLGDRLRKAREYAGLSQTDMADAIGISRGSVGHYESGKYPTPRPVLISWALRTGVALDWLEREGLPHLDSNQEPSASPSAPVQTGAYEFPADAEPDILTFRKAMGLNGAPRHGTRVPDHPKRVR